MATTDSPEFVDTPAVAEDDLDSLPAPPRRKSRVSVATILLALAAVGCIGFALGVVVEKKQLPESNPTQVQSAAGGGGAGAARTTTTVAGGAAAGAGAALGGGGGLIGQVTAVSGTSMTVTDASGNAVKVTISPQTVLTKTGTITAADIKAGDYVTVAGPTGADGTTTANRIVDSGATPPAAAGRPGAGAAGGGPGSTTPGASVPPGPAGSRPLRTTTVP